MASDSSLAGLLDRAASVFQWAGKLGRSFQEDHSSPQWQTDPKGWEYHKPDVKQFSDDILCLREAMENSPPDFVPVVKPLREAAHIARGILDVMQKREGNQWSAFLNYYPDLNSVSYEGYQAIKQAREAILAEDPFAFLDKEEVTEPEPEFTALEKYPMTPEGHVKFLEWVRDEVSDLAKAKAQKLERSYTNDTLDGTLRGIKWEEAKRRLEVFAGGSTEGLQPVANVLQMDLTIGAIEYIDEQFQKAMRWLRELIQRDKSIADKLAIVRTAGDLYLAIKHDKLIGYEATQITFKPGPNGLTESCNDPREDAVRMAQDYAQALITLEGGDQTTAIAKLIARVQIQKKMDRASVLNMPITDFVGALDRETGQVNQKNQDAICNDSPRVNVSSDKSGLDTGTAMAGFLGGISLADTLGVHPTRREAFFRKLERLRVELGDSSWHEIREPRPNSPRYLYRADLPKIREIVESYKQPKRA